MKLAVGRGCSPVQIGGAALTQGPQVWTDTNRTSSGLCNLYPHPGLLWGLAGSLQVPDFKYLPVLVGGSRSSSE
jgi:hypothetical protein